MARGGAALSSEPATTPAAAAAAAAASAGGAAASSTALASPSGASQGPSSAKTRASSEQTEQWAGRGRKEGPHATAARPSGARGGARGAPQWKAKNSAPSSSQQQQQQSTAATTAAGGGAQKAPPAASLSDPRVASHLSLVRDIRMTFPSDDVRSASPRTASMVESVHPVLECYNYSKQDVLQLVRRLQHREDLIHSEVARVIEESTGHEQGSWKMVGKKQQQQPQQTGPRQQTRGYRQGRDGRGFEGRRQQQRGQGRRTYSERRQNGRQLQLQQQQESCSNTEVAARRKLFHALLCCYAQRETRRTKDRPRLKVRETQRRSSFNLKVRSSSSMMKNSSNSSVPRGSLLQAV